MATTNKWALAGTELVKKLRQKQENSSITEADIKMLSEDVVNQIKSAYPDTPNSQKKPLMIVRKAITDAFPSTQKQVHTWQYFTNSGKGHNPRYEHLALKYLTLHPLELRQSAQGERLEVPEEVEEIQQPEPPKLKLSELKLEALELDVEIQENIQDALNQSGKSFTDFCVQAWNVYAKTLTGKAKKHDEDLAAVSTESLLTSKTYATHPGRASELTKRCIYAMMAINDQATEINDKWCITQSAIAEITGSKPASVGKILQQYQQMIQDHHIKHLLLNDQGLPNTYINRKKGKDITVEIDLVTLLPDGMDL